MKDYTQPTSSWVKKDYSKPIDSPAYGGREGRSRFQVSGPLGFASAPGAEDVLPAVGQTVGGMIPGVNAFGGSVAGATSGQAARQAVKSLRGEKASLGEIPSEALRTATTEGIFRGAGKLMRPLAGRLMNSVLKPATKEISEGKNLGLEALDAGIFGSKKGMLSKAKRIVSEGEGNLQGLIKTKPGSVDLEKALSGLDELEARYASIGDQGGLNAIKNLREAVGTGRLNLENANQLKRNLYDALRESQFGTSEIPSIATVRKSAAHGLKKGIEEALPEQPGIPGAKSINQKIGLGARVRDALENRIASEERSMIVPKIAMIGAGASALTGHLPAALGIMGGEAIVEGLRSAPVMTTTAAALNALAKRKAIMGSMRLGASELARRI